jgi:hypothetical protein
MALMDSICVTIGYMGHDEDAAEHLTDLESLAKQAGATSDPSNKSRGPDIATNEGGDWYWEFYGTPVTLKAFLELIQAKEVK